MLHPLILQSSLLSQSKLMFPHMLKLELPDRTQAVKPLTLTYQTESASSGTVPDITMLFLWV
jgi:hypothetical protein